jgi:hypothetical protein
VLLTRAEIVGSLFCYTVVTLLSHCYHTVTTLLSHCCYTYSRRGSRIAATC